MSDGKNAVFWSYAHEDDRLDSGNIRALATHISNEFSLVTGEEIDLFLDRDSIVWGDEWRARIDGALVETSFFIPILTPRYFQRSECQREALSFHGKAKSLGVEELILPILYSPVEEFNESNSNELTALLSRFQYVDWTSLRLEGSTSPDYRKSVHELAERLAKISASIRERQLHEEIQGVKDAEAGQGDVGLFDLWNEIQEILPDWIDLVETDVVLTAQHDATWDIYGPKLAKLEGSRGRAGAKFALIQKIATEQLPMAKRFLDGAEKYVQKTVALDPLILQLIRLSENDSEAESLLESLRGSISQASTAIRYNERRKVEPGFTPASVWARRRANTSRLVREVADIWDKAERTAHGGNDVVMRWVSELERASDSSLNAGAN